MLNRKPISEQRGLGLIEIMITLIILAIGFLAAANMQIRGMRGNLDSMQRAQALLSMNDMMDRMRNNPQGVQNGHYNGRSTGTLTQPTCASTGCSNQQLADMDFFEWSANFEALRGETNFTPLLPGENESTPAQGHISQPLNGVYTISLQWQGSSPFTQDASTLEVKFAP